MSRPASGDRAFTAAEELACYFDTAGEPCNIHLEVAVAGALDEAALRAAAVAALTGNEATGARRAPRGRLSPGFRWQRAGQLDTDPVTTARHGDAGQLAQLREAFLATAPPVDVAPPARLLLASGPGGDHVILNAHHAVMDGMSCLELLREIARQYRAAAGLPPARPPAGLPVPAPVPAPPAGASQPAAGRRRPARIAPDGGGGRGCGCGVHLDQLRPVPAVRPLAGGGKPTLNEALAAALVTAVGRWNAGHGRAARPVRLTIPINTRRPGTPFAAGNGSRLATVRADPFRAGSTGTLLRAVAAQARAARQAAGSPQLGRASRALAGPWCPAPVKHLAVRLVLATAAPLVVDTVMLSNLGNVADPPDFGVPGPVTMAFSVPAQLPRGLSVGVLSADGTLTIGVRYNRAILDGPATARFTALLRAALAETTTAGPPPRAGPQ